MEQVRIIQEEVERSDRIISRLISDGRMSEGQVEKLDVIEELDKALREVFPKGAPFDVMIHRDFGRQLPYVLMQRNHLSEIFLNLLQNAREALNGKGNIWIEAHQQGEYSVEVSVRDDGPGIPSDKLSRVFEAYYTSKEGGSGLGLAIARHNAELYGGTLEVQSELGKGARFTLVFPSRALIHPSK
jgi:signal transduction histidine kinase